MLQTELRKIENEKTKKIYYILDVYIIYKSNKRFRLKSIFIQRHQYLLLGGKD